MRVFSRRSVLYKFNFRAVKFLSVGLSFFLIFRQRALLGPDFSASNAHNYNHHQILRMCQKLAIFLLFCRVILVTVMQNISRVKRRVRNDPLMYESNTHSRTWRAKPKRCLNWCAFDTIFIHFGVTREEKRGINFIPLLFCSHRICMEKTSSTLGPQTAVFA